MYLMAMFLNGLLIQIKYTSAHIIDIMLKLVNTNHKELMNSLAGSRRDGTRNAVGVTNKSIFEEEGVLSPQKTPERNLESENLSQIPYCKKGKSFFILALGYI